MKEILSKFAFWRKFSRYLLVGMSAIILLTYFQTAQVPLFAAVSCTVPPSQSAINSPTSGQIFTYGTTNVNISWTASNADFYRVIVTNTTNGANTNVFSDDNYTSTTVSVPVQNGNYYTASVLPRNSCGQGGSYQVSFSVQAAPTSCTNTQCVTCGSGDDAQQVCPTPENNCQAFCPGGGPGQFSGCSISQNLVGQPNLYSLTGYPSNFPYSNYNWDLNNDFVYNDAQGPNVQRNFTAYTTVRLQVRDTNNNLCTATATINPSGSTNDTPTCSLTPLNPSYQNPQTVSFNAYVTPVSGRSIQSYQWSFNGILDTSYTGTYASHYFPQSQNASLRIYDGVRDYTCSSYVTIGSGSNQCDTIPYPCPNGNGRQIYKFYQPNLGRCDYDYNQCNTSGGNGCYNLACNLTAPSGCYYPGQSTSSCNPTDHCGQLVCNNNGGVNNGQCILGGPGVASYPGNPGSQQWCDCAQRNNDVGSLMNYSCYNAPRNPSTGGIANRCEDLGRNNQVCGQRTYANCEQRCDGTRAYYHCVAPENNQCQGDIYCNTEDNRCGGGQNNGGGLGQLLNCPAGTSAQAVGNNQSTQVCVANLNENLNANLNENINNIVNENISNSISSAWASGGSAWAGGGGAGSASVNITW